MAAKKGSGRSSSSTTRKSPGRSVVAATPPQGSRRSTSSSRGGSGEVRRAISGRETELAAIASFVVGVLIALAVYVELAGPVGRGADAALGAVIGMGRYLLPVVAVTIGVILIREDDAPGRTKMTLGWGGLVVAVLGIVHIGRGPDGYRGVDDLGGAGGWIGAVVGQTLRALIGPIGAVLVLVAIGLAATLLITRWSLRDLFERLRHLGSALSERLGSGLREAADDLSTLKSDRDDTTATTTPASAVHEPGLAPLVPAQPEDSSDESADDANDAEPAPVLRRRSRRESSPEPSSTSPDPTQVPVQESLDVKVTVPRGDWKLPPASSLVRTGAQSIDELEIDRRGRILEESLSSHGVDVRLVGRTVGPTVTRYELELGPGVKVARVTSLQKDIAYSLAATDVRILAPIPGRSAIGIEVPNSSRQLVALGDLMASAEAKNATHPLDVAIGKDISGRSVFLNLSTTPHLLIAGATGAGKSSGINCIITSLLMRTTPDQVKLILVDPKQVEMGQYARLPHLLTQPVNNPKKAANALAWAVREMEKRYDLLYEMGYRDITGYNAAFDRGELVAEAGTDRTFERMKYIVVVVDELNDLMMVAARDVEESITRIAQKARAVGIHLIIATQRPSVNVITGVIKANIPARMAFAVSSQMDSRVILDQVGAEKLVGRGDMLLLPGNSSVAQRIQGCWVTEDEVRKVVAHWRQQAPEVEYVKGVEGDEPSAGGSAGSAITDSYGNDDDDESLLRQAMELVVRSQLGSTSMLQRKLKVGFARAGRIMDLLEERGVVGPSTGSKAREVLMTVEELEAQA
ncbi:MAG: DNA translocase FtsK 4TM domain-containing protein [Ilumatobacteraceae bacterium]